MRINKMIVLLIIFSVLLIGCGSSESNVGSELLGQLENHIEEDLNINLASGLANYDYNKSQIEMMEKISAERKDDVFVGEIGETQLWDFGDEYSYGSGKAYGQFKVRLDDVFLAEDRGERALAVKLHVENVSPGEGHMWFDNIKIMYEYETEYSGKRNVHYDSEFKYFGVEPTDGSEEVMLLYSYRDDYKYFGVIYDMSEFGTSIDEDEEVDEYKIYFRNEKDINEQSRIKKEVEWILDNDISGTFVSEKLSNPEEYNREFCFVDLSFEVRKKMLNEPIVGEAIDGIINVISDQYDLFLYNGSEKIFETYDVVLEGYNFRDSFIVYGFYVDDGQITIDRYYKRSEEWEKSTDRLIRMDEDDADIFSSIHP